MTELSPQAPAVLVQQWIQQSTTTECTASQVATLAAQWGADAELEACCEWVDSFQNKFVHAHDLRLVRRPKPPSLKEQALEALAHILNNSSTQLGADTIRRALEQLPDNE
jgi:hypothetical protein